MCSRGYYFLDRLIIRYCKNGGSSTNVRTWMRENLKDFANTYPNVKVETKYVANKHPILIGEYKNGLSRQVCVKNMPVKEIDAHINSLVSTNGHKVTPVTKSVFTKCDSFQGKFDDYLHLNSIKVKYVPQSCVCFKQIMIRN